MLNGQFQVNGLCPGCGRVIKWEQTLRDGFSYSGYSSVCSTCQGTISITLRFQRETEEIWLCPTCKAKLESWSDCPDIMHYLRYVNHPIVPVVEEINAGKD